MAQLSTLGHLTIIMKMHLIIPLLLLAGYCSGCAQTNNATSWDWQKPIIRDGSGVPIGTLGVTDHFKTSHQGSNQNQPL